MTREIVRANGVIEYYTGGYLHNTTGPARIYPSGQEEHPEGKEEYHYKGKELSKEKWEKKINNENNRKVNKKISGRFKNVPFKDKSCFDFELVSLLDHPIRILFDINNEKFFVDIEKSDWHLRVDFKEYKSIPFIHMEVADINIPPKKYNTYFIVSKIALEYINKKYPDRDDFVSPGKPGSHSVLGRYTNGLVSGIS